MLNNSFKLIFYKINLIYPINIHNKLILNKKDPKIMEVKIILILMISKIVLRKKVNLVDS